MELDVILASFVKSGLRVTHHSCDRRCPEV